MSALGEDVTGSTPDASDLNSWAGLYGLTTPVVADPNYDLLGRYSTAPSVPAYTLIGPGGEVISRAERDYDRSEIEAVLPY